jgi:hypothetical protein
MHTVSIVGSIAGGVGSGIHGCHVCCLLAVMMIMVCCLLFFCDFWSGVCTQNSKKEATFGFFGDENGNPPLRMTVKPELTSRCY